MSEIKLRSRYAAQANDDDEEQTNSADGVIIGDDETATSSSGKFTTADVIAANQKLLNAISRCDYQTYRELCAEDLTAFEPESNGMLICGLSFHKYYFDLYSGNCNSGDDATNIETIAAQQMTNNTTTNKKINVTMSNPHVRWLGGGCCSDGCGDGSAAVISYVRMDQIVDLAVSSSSSFSDEKGNDGNDNNVRRTTSSKPTGGPVTRISSETRVWENRDGRLVHVHFHKS
jgi:hypothetical protein